MLVIESLVLLQGLCGPSVDVAAFPEAVLADLVAQPVGMSTKIFFGFSGESPVGVVVEEDSEAALDTDLGLPVVHPEVLEER